MFQTSANKFCSNCFDQFLSEWNTKSCKSTQRQASLQREWMNCWGPTWDGSPRTPIRRRVSVKSLNSSVGLCTERSHRLNLHRQRRQKRPGLLEPARATTAGSKLWGRLFKGEVGYMGYIVGSFCLFLKPHLKQKKKLPCICSCDEDLQNPVFSLSLKACLFLALMMEAQFWYLWEFTSS